jgi:trimethylamine---corrinoid protein Co-methyltransferase
MQPTTRRSGGRVTRLADRRKNTGSRAVAPGLPGGQYRPLTDDAIERIHHTALDVLENIGVADAPPALVELATAKGCRMDERGRLHFPRGLVEDIIAGAAREFQIHGRNPKHDLTIGGARVHMTTAGEAVTILDLEAKHFRPSTLVDLYDMARLVDRLEHIHQFGQTVVATDITVPFEHDMSIAYAILAATEKSFGVSMGRPEHIAPAVELFDMALGGEGRFLARPVCVIGCCPIVSPLRFAREATDVLMETTRRGLIGDVAIAAQAGATAPAALAGTLVQTVAETLASVIVVNLVKPGHPTIFGIWPFVSDLRTGSFTGGGGEEAVLSAAAMQIANYYDLPASVGAGMTDSKLPDNQAGYEKGVSTALAALAGGNYVCESAGMLASLLGCSFEALVIDNDMLGMVQRALRGIEVTDETLSYDVIREAVEGAGHFLGAGQTLEFMHTEYVYPSLADRSAAGAWEEGGKPELLDRARERVREILSQHYPTYVDAKTDAAIRERFPIRLPREAMRADSRRW